MYTNVITLFNFCKASRLWYPTVLPNVDLIAVQGNSKVQHGITNNNTAEVIIHSTADKMIMTNSGLKRFVGTKEYMALTDPESYITFTPEKDFIIDGVYEYINPISDENFDSGLYHELNEAFDNVYLITSAVFYNLIPHFELGAK